MGRRVLRGPRARRSIVAALAVFGLAAGFALERVELRGVTVDALTTALPREDAATPPAGRESPPGGPDGQRMTAPSPRSDLPGAPPPIAPARSSIPDAGQMGPRSGPFADGLAAFRRGDAHGAAMAFEAARRIAPHSPEILVNLGFAYLALERLNEAAALFQRATTIDPMMAAPYYGLAQHAEARGDLETARGSMRTYLHLAPEGDAFRRKAMAALWEWSRPPAAAAPPGAAVAPDVAAAPGAADPATLAATAAPQVRPADGVTIAIMPRTGDDAAARLDPRDEELVAAAGTPADADGLAARGILDAPLATLDGMPATLAPFSDRLVVLNIWAAWCGPCRMELPSLDRLAAALDPARAAVVGVSIDRQPAFTREFLRETGVGLTTLWDGGGALTRGVLDVRALPLTLLLAPGGEVLLRHEGALDWAAPEIVAALAELSHSGGTRGVALARLAEAIR